MPSLSKASMIPSGMPLGVVLQKVLIPLPTSYNKTTGIQVDLTDYFGQEIYAVLSCSPSSKGWLAETWEEDVYTYENRKFVIRLIKTAGVELRNQANASVELGREEICFLVFGK